MITSTPSVPTPWSPPRFQDRKDAGRRLAALVRPLRLEDPLVLALPRGGVPVAAEVSRALGAPLDVWVSKKLGAPESDEVAIGAVSEGGELLVDPELASLSGADDEYLQMMSRARQREVVQQALRLREGRPPPHVRGRDVVLVDDGVATGLTALAALRDLRRGGAMRTILAVPVGALSALDELADDAEVILCLAPLEHLHSVGSHYEDFAQVNDAEVLAHLRAARRRAK
jgi:putative phosphoribosyl transferase